MCIRDRLCNLGCAIWAIRQAWQSGQIGQADQAGQASQAGQAGRQGQFSIFFIAKGAGTPADGRPAEG
eukprot:9695254-Karenia_brevis.AAC.1